MQPCQIFTQQISLFYPWLQSYGLFQGEQRFTNISASIEQLQEKVSDFLTVAAPCSPLSFFFCVWLSVCVYVCVRACVYAYVCVRSQVFF